MINGQLAMVVTCDNNDPVKGHCGQYFKLALDVTDIDHLNVPQRIRVTASQAGWIVVDGKDICLECKPK